ncbi:MAG TPA: hypothetical protein VF092_18335 [Longimicrobium sp.]
MKKLILRVDTLRVESFDVSERERASGTVHAHDGTWGETCNTQCATGICDCVLTDVC